MEGVGINAADYRSRVAFATRAAITVEDVLGEFYELYDYSDGVTPDDYDIAEYLDKQGYNLTGEYFHALRRALEVLQRITGEARISAERLNLAETRV